MLFGWRKRNNTFRLDFLVVQIRLGEEIGMSGVSERLAGAQGTPHHMFKKEKKGLSEVGQVLQERFATGNERDLRKSFSGSRTSAQAITPALIVESLY